MLLASAVAYVAGYCSILTGHVIHLEPLIVAGSAVVLCGGVVHLIHLLRDRRNAAATVRGNPAP